MKTLKFLIILIIFNLINLMSLNAQVTQEWAQRYDEQAEEDYANSIAVDDSGNVFVTGTIEGSEFSTDYATIKYNSKGIQQWIQRYNGPGNHHDGANDLAVDGSGNVYVTGSSTGSNLENNYATIKYNSLGVQQWVQRYVGGGSFDRANCIAVDGSANVYVTGYSIGSGTGFDYATIKYNSAGVQQWVQRYNGPGNGYDIANSIAVDGSGNVYVTGSSDGGQGFDFATIKYNSAGVEQWVQRYNGAATSIAVDGSGNVYVTGLSDSSGINMDFTTIKYNSQGAQQWIQRYNGPGNSVDYAQSIAVDGSANVYVTGPSFGIGTSADFATIKYNTQGVQQWTQRYNGPGNSSDEAESLVVDDSGNVYVTGGGRPGEFSRGDEVGTNKDYATIKYNSSGVQQWVQRYNGPADSVDYATSIAVDGSGNVFVAGGSKGNGTNYDYATIKYSQTVGIHSISNEIPKEYMLSQNYPNPFNPTTIINYELGITNFVSLKVYDAVGKEVLTLVNEKQNAGKYSVTFNGSSLPSGIYFYKIEILNTPPNPSQEGSFVQTKKMLLIK